ncbi:MAG TPA: FxsA family protein, partial [Solirubrobacterales bacterium]|nr:FxsA family protein [Solirubrobacterales bacterium]
IAELYVIIQVGGAIGVLPTLAILVADAILGAFLLRQQGRAAWVRFNRALAENRLPHREVFDGVLIIFGGALLMTPGFITDIFGLVLLIPPTRALVRAFTMRMVRGRMAAGGRVAYFGYGPPPRQQRAPGSREPRPAPGPEPTGDPFAWEDPFRPSRRAGPRPEDIEGTGHEVRDEDELPPGREPFGG